MNDIIEEPVEEMAESTLADENNEPETPEVEDDTSEQKAEQEKKDKTQRRIDELTRQKYESRKQAEDAIRENEQLRRAIAEAQEGGQPLDVNNIQEIIKLEAQKLRAEESFNDACNRTYDQGVKEFPDFDKAVSNLQLIGMRPEFLELVTSSDVGAKVLHHLGNDFEEAERIAALSPIKMAREIAKLELELASKKKTVSKAPEPIKTVAGRSGGNKDPYDMTDAEYMKWRKGK